MKEGKPIKLAAPYDHISVQYPYDWGGSRVHVFDESKGEGIVYGPGYAKALADALTAAFATWEEEKK